MKRAEPGQLLLETIKLGRHVGQLGLRPAQRVLGGGAQAFEDLALWSLKPLEELAGRRRAQRLKEAYFQLKDVVGEVAKSLSHQSRASALQSAAEVATYCLRQAGLETRVLGPLDEHWRALRLLRNLRAAIQEREERESQALKMTPRRFVAFMLEAEHRKRRSRQKDPVEVYVDWMLTEGGLSRMGPMFFEKRIYMDMARIICFAFDRALTQANGANVWGQELRVKVAKEAVDFEVNTRRMSKVRVEQVEVLVDQMLKSNELTAPPFMASVQRQLLVNCSMVVLQLIEDLTSDRQLRMVMLGHSLHLDLQPLQLDTHMRQLESIGPEHFRVNQRAVDELVDALLEAEGNQFQSIFVPDVLEEQVYRYVLTMMVCIGRFMLAQVRLRLFGMEVRFDLVAEDEGPTDTENVGGVANDGAPAVQELNAHPKDLENMLARIEAERQHIRRELQMRHGELEEKGWRRSSLNLPTLGKTEEGPSIHEFQKMAALDQLSRCIAVQRLVPVSIETAYETVARIAEYPKWMPLVSSAKVISEDVHHISCQLAFGPRTGTLLDLMESHIAYRVRLLPPHAIGEDDWGPREARIVSGTEQEFSYGKRLIFDWRLVETGPGETDVRVDVFFQAKNVLYLPFWDSLQAAVSNVMMKKFQERAFRVADTLDPDGAALRAEFRDSSAGCAARTAGRCRKHTCAANLRWS